MTKIESHVPQGPITEKWSKHKAEDRKSVV